MIMRVLPVGILLVLPLAAPAATPEQKCEKTVASKLASCVATVGAKVRKCYVKNGAGGAACVAADPGVTEALVKLESKILAACPDAGTVQGVGYGAALVPAGLVARAREACLGEPATLAARTFGGPQAAILVAATPDRVDCLDASIKEALKLVKKTASLDASCIAKAHKGKTCDTAKVAASVAAAEGKASARIAATCGDLKAAIGMDVATFVARAGAQARCLAATAHGDTGPLTLDCGPRGTVPVPPRGQWVQVTLDSASGALCGDGSPYSFWLRLAPAASPAEKIVVDLQGGGVCIFESDCVGVATGAPGLLRSDDDGQPTGGYMSDNPATNPFADWTRIFLPYCTQDVHIGGGRDSVFPSLTVRRHGALNVRQSLAHLRDVLWQDLDATTTDGYRPDRLTVLFAGESAGAFGVQYNYHWLLDEMRWIHTTAAPDSGLALDNGSALGVAGLGAVIQLETNPLGWGTQPFQPPYCMTGGCAVGPVLQAATSVRLKAVPEQQILNISNQIDSTQVSTTFFSTPVGWINACRDAYCDNQGLTGVRYWMPAESTPFHTILRTPARFDTTTADGVTVAQWLADAMVNPNAVVDRVDEGDLVADYPGVHPIACIASASGAFLD